MEISETHFISGGEVDYRAFYEITINNKNASGRLSMRKQGDKYQMYVYVREEDGKELPKDKRYDFVCFESPSLAAAVEIGNKLAAGNHDIYRPAQGVITTRTEPVHPDK